MYIYIITVITDKDTYISQEGYISLKDAQDFIKSRSDKPDEVTEFWFESDTHAYKIREIHISGVNRGSVWKINNYGMVEKYDGK